MGIMGDKKRYFILKSKQNKSIKCYYASELESTVKELYKKWVYVTGNPVHKQKTSHLESVTNIKEQMNESLSQIGKYPLKKPVVFKTCYELEDNLWGLENDELALNGYGTNYENTISSLEEELEGHVLSFTKYPDECHSDGSLKIKNELKKHIDFQVVLTFLKGTKDGRYAKIDPNIVETPRSMTSRNEFLIDEEMPILFDIINKL